MCIRDRDLTGELRRLRELVHKDDRSVLRGSHKEVRVKSKCGHNERVASNALERRSVNYPHETAGNNTACDCDTWGADGITGDESILAQAVHPDSLVVARSAKKEISILVDCGCYDSILSYNFVKAGLDVSRPYAKRNPQCQCGTWASENLSVELRERRLRICPDDWQTLRGSHELIRVTAECGHEEVVPSYDVSNLSKTFRYETTKSCACFTWADPKDKLLASIAPFVHAGDLQVSINSSKLLSLIHISEPTRPY